MNRTRFADRQEAGRLLADAVAEQIEADEDRLLVLGIPRGGVPVAGEVAEALHADLDVLIARKVGAPGNPELGLGAVTPDGEATLDEGMLRRLGVTQEHLERVIARETEEIHRRLDAYREGRPPLSPAGRRCLIVDDGIATGGTAKAAAGYLRRAGATWVGLAVPVAPMESMRDLQQVFDEVVVLSVPTMFWAVGEWYADFHQVSDEEVIEVLRR